MLNDTASIQTSPAIIVVPAQRSGENSTTIGIYEFLTKSFAYCPIETLHWLSYFIEPRSRKEAQDDHPQYSNSSLNADIDELVEAGFLIDAVSEHAKRCTEYREKWKWDLTTAAFHFTVLNNSFCSPDESIAQQLANLEIEQQPDYFWPPKQVSKFSLPNPFLDKGHQTISTLANRRTNRKGSGEAITVESLSSCLYASFGIIGLVKSTTGDLPLTMTPSGGARNPYEAFVVIKKCENLAPGVYHYSAIEHTLELVQSLQPDTPIAQHFAGQDWIDEMAAVVVMVAVFERTMWKYQDPNAYRVVLIEAGHKAQNFMTMATHLGLTSCPSAALAHDSVAALLNLKDRMLHVPIYAFTLDNTINNEDEVVQSRIYRSFIDAKTSNEFKGQIIPDPS